MKISKSYKRLLGIFISGSLALGAWADTVTMHTPESFQVISMSPNGKWACGVYVDAVSNTYGFRWDLESGEIDMLGYESTLAYGVANDGTVSGEFPDPQASSNGVPVTMPGFWRDGSWHHLEMPAGATTEGIGYGISPDGHYMTGSIVINGIYNAVIWKEGQVHRLFQTGNHSVAMAVSPDGDGATGFSTQNNRTACYWTPDGQLIYFEDSEGYSQSPWSYGRKFSPDGSKLLYWGGWDIDENQQQWLYAVYDIATGERIKIPVADESSDLELFDISNNGVLVGMDRNCGYVWNGERGLYIDDYLTERGADIKGFDDFYGGDDYYQNQLPISTIVGISEDENVFAMRYYNKRGQLSSMVVKLDQDFAAVAPVNVKASQLVGLNTVALNWFRPVGATSIRGFNVYRNGVKINGFMPLTSLSFYDRVTPGTYSYQVSAVNISGAEVRSPEISVTVEPVDAPAEAASSLFTRQKGFNSASVLWNAPLSNRVHNHYYKCEPTDMKAFTVYAPMEVEMGVKYDKAHVANYAGYKLAEVSFMPMAQHSGWTLNVYSRNDDSSLKPLYSQPVNQELQYKTINTVKLDQPLDIPAGDLIVAFSVMCDGITEAVIGADLGNVVVGYSDLMRQKGADDDFFSAFDSSAAGGYSISTISWAIDLGFEPAGYSDTDNAIDHYDVYLDGELAVSTDNNSTVINDLADGSYSVSVATVYANGNVSPLTNASIDIKITYPRISDVDINVGSDGQTEISASWTAPTDSDLTPVTYSTATNKAYGIKGVASNGYALMASAEYPASMLRGLEGYRVNSFKFFPLTDALFTFMLHENDELIYELEVEDYTIGEWNEIFLPDEVFIKPNATYSLIIDCFDPIPDVELLGLDNKAPRSYVSDLYSIDNGQTWGSISTDTGAVGNWMLGLTVVDTDVKELPITGYEVVVDNAKVTDGVTPNTSVTFDLGKWDSRSHSLRVDAYYEGRDSAVKGRTNTFKLSPSGITDAEISAISILRGTNYIMVDDESVAALQLFSADGKAVASASGNKVSISGVPAGVYVLQITMPDRTVNRKVSIEK